MLESVRNIYFSALSAWLAAHYSDVVSHASEPGWNRDRLVALASSSGVLCALHSQSLSADLLSQIPLELQSLFATAQRLNAERNSIALNQIVASKPAEMRSFYSGANIFGAERTHAEGAVGL